MLKVTPSLLVHADWSTDTQKRWMAMATRRGEQFLVDAPRPVGELESFFPRVAKLAPSGAILVGFDFPVGVPRAFAVRAKVERFRDELLQFGKGRWSDFYEVANTREQISLTRPFYPQRPGQTRRCYLVDALGVTDFRDLLRECDRATRTRAEACSLFWTLGRNQVGRAAISGWRDLLAPALRQTDRRIALWPFDGELECLLETFPMVVVETYPAEACCHIGIESPGRRWSKRRRADRALHSDQIFTWFESRRVVWTKALRAEICSGFSEDRSGEDRFDALLGLLSMLEVVLGSREGNVPQTEKVLRLEGWILGQGKDDTGNSPLN